MADVFRIQKIKSIQVQREKELFEKPNVVSVGYGYKIVDGKRTDEVVLIVGVKKKVPTYTMRTKDIIPTRLDGVKTDVVEVGEVKAFFDPTKKHRPAPPGSSISHPDVTAGTFSCVVKRDGKRMILSNCHVMANSNNAEIGDKIYQPGVYDSGTIDDTIATLYDFKKINFPANELPSNCDIASGFAGVLNFLAKLVGSKHRVKAYNTQARIQDLTNTVDAALGLPINDADITEDIAEIGKPIGLKSAELGMEIQKYGRTTKYTKDVVTQLNVTTSVSYGASGIAMFTGQIMAGAMSAGGDSGSAILDMDKNLIGLLFAGSDTTTIINPMQDVFSELNLTLD